MRIRSIASLYLLALACSSGGSQTAVLMEPEFQIRQVGGQPAAARYVQGPISVNVQVLITNRSSEPLTVDRIQIESIGAGAYTVPSTSRPFGQQILPERFELMNLWLPAIVENTILGANGPVTVRSVVYFTSPAGKFQRVYVRQLNDQTRTRQRD